LHKKLNRSVHSATLGKGKSDGTLVKIKNGDLKGKGEVTLVFGKQDTHVDRAGRTLIRDTFDDAGLTMTVSNSSPTGPFTLALPNAFADSSSLKFKRSMLSSVMSLAKDVGTLHSVGVCLR